MDRSPGSDAMDWEEDSSLHIIQPASSPWRKRSFDTYNDTNEPYHTNEAYPGYRVTDTLRHHAEPAQPFLDFDGRPARNVTPFDGNVIHQPAILPQSPKPFGDHLPEFVKWIIYGTALLVFSSCELLGGAYTHTATVAVRVGSSAKRRLVEVTRKAFVSAPITQRHRRNVAPHRRRSPIIRRVSPTSPGGRTHVPVTPPRARPTATLNEAAVIDHECVFEHAPSNIEHQRSGASVTSSEDDRLMSGITHLPYPEPMMSGALQDIEMEEDLQSNATSSFSPYHVPGTFPFSPAPPGLPSTESSTPQPQISNGLAMLQERHTHDSATSEEQAAEEPATPHSEASDESGIPDVQPTITYPSQKVDSRPRNYRGELLDDWQIKLCREFQTIHPPPREMRQSSTKAPKQPQGLNFTGLIGIHRSPLLNPHQQQGTTATGLIDSPRSPLTNGSPAITPHQQQGTTATGLIDSPRSPLTNGSPAITSHQQQGTAATGLIDSHRSPLANGSPMAPRQQHGMAATGLIDSPRSPLANGPPLTPRLQQETVATGLIDSHRSPLANGSPMAPRQQHGTAVPGLIDSPRSPFAEVSPFSSRHETNSAASIDSPRPSSVDVSSMHLQPGASVIAMIDAPRSLPPESPIGAAVEPTMDTYEAGPEISDGTQAAESVPSSPLTNHLATINTMPTKSPSKWSLRSLYARVQSKPKKRSPLRERINNANFQQAPKTPKKVTWPENGPVTGTKRFIKHEPMSHPSPTSSREDSSILSSVPSELSPQPSPTMQEEEEEEAALNPPYKLYTRTSAGADLSMSPNSINVSDVFSSMSTTEHTDAILNSGERQTISSSSSSDNEAGVHSVETPTKTAAADPSTPPSHLSPKFEELTISTRRSSLRRREKEDQAKKLRDAIAAEEKARKDKEEAEEKARKDKEEAEERARIKAEEEEVRKKTGGRHMPIERVIQSLPPEWDEKVRSNMAKGMREQLAMTSVGNPLTRRDFGMVLPQPGTGDDPSGWLNDEIISGYLQAVVDHGHRAMGHPRGAKPRMHAFNPFFYTTLKERGYDAVKRWSSRAKIGGNDLKAVEYVFIPCNPTKSHWTLVVVSPARKTIEVFDSMHGDSTAKVNTTKVWLKGELGRSYVDSEWTVIEDPTYRGRGKGPTQNNINDCGVFTVTTAKMLVLGVDPMAVSAGDMPLQRRRLVAELLNGGFSGEFEPRVVFE